MEEKHYPILEEEDSTLSSKVEEPVDTIAYSDEEVALMTRNDELDWDDMPLIGPATYEEAMSRIDAAEKECEEGEGTAWDDVMQEARNLVLRNYGAAIY